MTSDGAYREPLPVRRVLTCDHEPVSTCNVDGFEFAPVAQPLADQHAAASEAANGDEVEEMYEV